MRWCNEPFPECCLHCPAHRLSEGNCGHGQRELLTDYFARHPRASCPVFGDKDVEPCAENPIAEAIDGIRYAETFSDAYDIDIREYVLVES